MPLVKVEELTDILVNRGYIKVPRSHRFRAEFRERSELLVMAALYRLGNGNSFRQLRSMCHISVSEIRLFFFEFVNVMVEMKDEYIFLPRNIAEYIQASSRVARSEHGIVFTVHHPFRSRDLSHYQRFKEFHEKFYSYVEPISVTPFANKALENYFALYLAFIVRHNRNWGLENNDSASNITSELKDQIMNHVKQEISMIHANAVKLNAYLSVRNDRMNSNIEGIIDSEEFENVILKLEDLIVERWLNRIDDPENPVQRYSEMNVDKLENNKS